MTTLEVRHDAVSVRHPETVTPHREPRPAAPPPAAAEFQPRDVFNALRYHSVLVVFLGTTIAAALASGAWFLFPSKYTTFAMVRVAASEQVVLAGRGTGRDEFVTAIRTKAGIIKSNRVMERVARDSKNYVSVRTQDDPLAYLVEKVIVEFTENSEVVKIGWMAEDPVEAAAVANAIMESLLTEEKFENDRKQFRIASLQAEGDKTQKTLTAMIQELNGVAAPVPGQEMKALTKRQRLDEYGALKRKRADLRAVAEQSRAKAEVAEKKLREAKEVDLPVPEPTAAIEADPAIRGQIMLVQRIETAISNHRRTALNPDASPYPEMAAKLATSVGTLEAMKKEFAQRFQERVKAWRLAELQTVVTKSRDEAEADAARERINGEQMKEYADLDKEDMAERTASDLRIKQDGIENTRATLREIESQRQRLSIELGAPDRVSKLQNAAVPQSKEIKKQVAFTAFGAIVGFGLVGFCVAGLELKRKRVYSATDAVFNSRLPLLGRVPEYGAAVPGRGDEPAGQAFHEAVDKLKAVVTRQMTRRNMQALLVTSAGPDEGKSLLAWSLALSLARTDKRTLYIDANLVNPSLHRHYDVAAEPGLSELLRGEKGLPEVVQRTPYGNLWCIAAGSCDEAARHTLDKERMRKFLDRARQDFDCIVIDSCSMQEAVDPLYLAQRVDATVLSLRIYRSRVADVERACARLGMLGTPLLGAVLTDSTLTANDL